MSDGSEVVYSYVADSSGVLDGIDEISSGIQSLIEDINALVEASSALGEFAGIFEEIAAVFGGVDEAAMGATSGIASMAEEAGVAADALGALGADGEAFTEVGASADEASAQIEGLTEMIDMLGGQVAEDTALIDSLNETIINLQAQIDMLTVSTDTAAASTDALGVSVSGFKEAQAPLMMLGMAGIAAGKSMFDMGTKAEDALNQVQALAGVGSQQMAQYTTQLEAQAQQYGESLDQEAQGLFYVTSAGFSGAGAMKVLAQSVMDAKAGNVDLAVSANGLTTVLNAYGASADQASQYNDIMMTAVTNGKQTFQDFATSIAKAAVEGNAAHISFNQVAAAEAALTDQGLSAKNASNDLTSMMRALDSNIDQTAKTAGKLGLSFNESAFKSMDLFHQMQYLQTITKGNQTELSKLVGGATGIAAYNALMTKSSDGTYKFATILDTMKHSTGAAAQAFATSQDTISAHMAKLNATLSVISYKALQDLAPVINKVADAFGKAADFLSQHMDIVMPILAAFAVLIGGIVVASIYMLLAPLFTLTVTVGALSAPFLAVAAVVAAVVAGIVYAVEHWGDIVGWLQGVWAKTPGFFSNLWKNIQGVFSGIGGWFHDKWQDAANKVVDSFNWLYNHNYYFKSLTDFIKNTTKEVADFLSNAWKTIVIDATRIWGDLTTKVKQLWQNISQFFIHAWDQYIGPALNGLWNKIKGAWDGFAANAENLGKNLMQHFASGAKSATSSMKQIGDRVLDLLGFHNAVGLAQKSGETLGAAARNIGANILSSLQQAGAKILSTIRGIGANIASWWNGLVTAFTHSPIGSAIIKTLKDSFAQVGQQFGQIGSTLKAQLGNAFSGVKDAFGNLGNSFSQIWQQQLVPIGQQIGGAFSDAWKTLAPIFAQVGKAIASIPWGEVLKAFGEIGKAIGGAFMTAGKALAPIFAQIGKAIASIPWGEIGHALAQIGAIVGGAFSQAWKALAPIFSEIGKIVGGVLLGALQAIGVILGGIVLLAISAVLGAIVGLAKAFATFVQGLSLVISGIVQVFSGIIQIVSGIVAFIVDLLTGHFNKLGADLGVIWNGIVTMFTGVWNIIKGIFTATIGAILSFIWGFIQTVIQFFINLGDSLGFHVSSMINGIVNWFQQLPGRAMTFITNLVNNISTTLGGLGAKALTWAGDMINNFVQGIENGIGAVGSAVSKIANKIAGFLHFSKPDVGPLADVDTWMPDFMTLLSKGIDDNIDKVKNSALNIATQISAASPNPSTLPQGPSAANGAANAQIAQILQQFLQQQQSRQQVPQPTNANLGAVTQHFSGGINFSGVPQDINALFQMLNQLSGLQFEYGQRGATFNY